MLLYMYTYKTWRREGRKQTYISLLVSLLSRVLEIRPTVNGDAVSRLNKILSGVAEQNGRRSYTRRLLI